MTAFATDEGLDVFQVMENMTRPGMEPERAAAARRCPHRDHAASHPARGGRPVPSGPEASVAEVRANPEVSTGMAPVYGMAASLPAEVVRGLLRAYLDMMFEV